MRPGKTGRGFAPQHRPGRQVLVQQRAPLAERDAERLVLVRQPGHGRLHDQAPAAEQVQRTQLAREEQRVPQRGDDGAGHQADPLGHRGDRGQQDQRAGPGGGRVLVAGQGVLARVGHQPGGARGRAQRDVLADHHRVEAGVLGLARPAHEPGQVPARGHGPVLAEDQAHPQVGHVTPPSVPHVPAADHPGWLSPAGAGGCHGTPSRRRGRSRPLPRSRSAEPRTRPPRRPRSPHGWSESPARPR